MTIFRDFYLVYYLSVAANNTLFEIFFNENLKGVFQPIAYKIVLQIMACKIAMNFETNNILTSCPTLKVCGFFGFRVAPAWFLGRSENSQ